MTFTALSYYLLKVSGCQVIFYLFFWVLLKQSSAFQWNRIYLLFSLGISFLVPLVSVSLPAEPITLLPNGNVFTDNLQTEGWSQDISHDGGRSLPWLMFLYLTGVAVQIFRMTAGTFQILKLRNKGRLASLKGTKVILLPEVLPPFSWGKWIFVPESRCTDAGISEILRHEQCHTNQLHTADVILSKLLAAWLWFNPFVFFHIKAIQDNHEFLADAIVLSNGTDKLLYQQLLLTETSQYLGLGNGFHSSTLKKRLIKMNTKNSVSLWKLIIALPIVVGVTLLFTDYSTATVATVVPIPTNAIPRAIDNPPSISPIQDGYLVRLSSAFGMRLHPILKEKKFHRGIDFATKAGVPVQATADGIIKKTNFATEKKGYGNYIVIDHDKTFSTLYAQLSEIKVKEGEKVKKGQVIGLVGSSGASTAPHLHYEVMKDGKHVNPADYLGDK
ncbi:peptidoglycan DD-metalloendopeptidase family protein [Limibacter armeniacum]|uniref:peptidoglycan DD-metalloendopeptidase family protein n=1 Tax=Limibacter armeniacum TaxID=466084 RepID=UPI002FE5E2A0